MLPLKYLEQNSLLADSIPTAAAYGTNLEEGIFIYLIQNSSSAFSDKNQDLF